MTIGNIRFLVGYFVFLIFVYAIVDTLFGEPVNWIGNIQTACVVLLIVAILTVKKERKK